MKYAVLVPLAATLFVANAFSQDRIYRCGNEYTNNAREAESRGCRVVEGGNVTIVQGTRAAPAQTGAVPVRVARAAGPRIDSADQTSRDGEARQILEAELKKTEARQSDLLKEYNNGEPEKRGDEARNYQKYLDRVAELKASIARNDTDIASLRRELGRMPATTNTN